MQRSNLWNGWVVARYGAPHRTVHQGHILITSAGNLVASKGFKVGVVDPREIEGLQLPTLREAEFC